MKKNDWLIIAGTAVYTFLFYDQSPGLNFLLFNLALIALLLIRDAGFVFKPAWLAAGAGSLISAFFVFKFGTTLTVMANLCSLFMLVGFSCDAESSLLIAVINAAFSTVASLPMAIGKMFSATTSEESSDGNILRKAPLLLIPVVVTTIFFFVYYAANPVFAKYVDEVNLDFISFEWLIFTLSGFFIMVGVFRHQIITWLLQVDKDSSDKLKVISADEHMAGVPAFSIQNEFLTGVILFCLLNLLLFSVNGLDVYYMWVANKLPAGVKTAGYLHDGAYTLIFSICMAIAVLLFVFRGYLNFFERNRSLKLLAYAWIAQNALLVITTAQRNWWTIMSSGITRKRIGVYVYLLLCLIGLTTTLIKVAQRNSNWFLFRKNAWAFYAVFIASCFVNWDDFIVRYNWHHYKTLKFEYIDRDYQADLSHTCLASLYSFYQMEKAEVVPNNKKMFTAEIVANMNSHYKQLKSEVDSASWKSYCLSKSQNVNAINEMMAKEK
jgi:hypothetical protein